MNQRGSGPWVLVWHDKTNAVGNVLKVLFVGDEDINDSKTYLERCVQTYSMALSNIILIRTHIKVSDILKGSHLMICMVVDNFKELSR